MPPPNTASTNGSGCANDPLRAPDPSAPNGTIRPEPPRRQPHACHRGRWARLARPAISRRCRCRSHHRLRWRQGHGVQSPQPTTNFHGPHLPDQGRRRPNHPCRAQPRLRGQGPCRMARPSQRPAHGCRGRCGAGKRRYRRGNPDTVRPIPAMPWANRWSRHPPWAFRPILRPAAVAKPACMPSFPTFPTAAPPAPLAESLVRWSQPSARCKHKWRLPCCLASTHRHLASLSVSTRKPFAWAAFGSATRPNPRMPCHSSRTAISAATTC